MPTPLYQYVAVDADVGQYVDLGNQMGIKLDGSAPFSITGWFRVQALANQANLVAKGAECALTLAGPTLSFQMAGQLGATIAAVDIVEMQWHFVVVTADLSQNAGLITLYLDGAMVGQTSVSGVGSPASEVSFMLAGGINVEFLSAAFYNAVLPAWACGRDWGPDAPPPPPPVPPPPAPVANFDFGSVPAADLGPSRFAVTLQAGARQVTLAPALSLYESWVTPAGGDSLNPTAGSPFSVQAWILPIPPTEDAGSQILTILGNGNKGDPGAFALTLTYDPSAGSFALGAALGGATPFTLVSQSPVPAGVWTNVAVTSAGPGQVALYVNGTAAGAATPATLPALAQPAVIVGAVYSDTAPGGVGDFFKGGIQAVSIWNQALAAADVATYMAQPALGAPGCVGYFDFATMDLSNQVTGNPVVLFENADILELRAAATQAIAPPRPVAWQQGGDPSPQHWHAAAARAVGIDGEDRPAAGLFEDDHVDAMLESYAARAESAPPAMRGWLIETHRRNLFAGIAMHQYLDAPPPGTFTHSREGDEWVIWHHGANGPEEAARLDAAEVSDCTAWTVAVVATAIGAVLAALGVAYVGTRLGNAITNQVAAMGATRWARLMQAVKLVLDERISASTFIQLVRTFYNSANLVSAVSASLAGVSWWDWTFTIANTIISIAGLWLTGGWFTIFILAQLALSLAQLGVVVSQRPAGC